MDNFVPAIDEAELKDGKMTLVKIAGREILLARIGGRVFGVSNFCPCKGCSLSKGQIDGYIVTCPCHGWQFDVRTGQHLRTKKIRLTTYRTKIEDGKIHVEMF